VQTPKSSPRGRLLEQYVCVRLVSNSGVDIELFEAAHVRRALSL